MDFVSLNDWVLDGGFKVGAYNEQYQVGVKEINTLVKRAENGRYCKGNRILCCNHC